MNLCPLHCMKLSEEVMPGISLYQVNSIYPIFAETPIIFVLILFQICVNFCITPWIRTYNVWAILKVYALINFEAFFRSDMIPNERNKNIFTICLFAYLRDMNEWKITWSASIWRFASCHARKVARRRIFMVNKVKGFISLPNVHFY